MSQTRFVKQTKWGKNLARKVQTKKGTTKFARKKVNDKKKITAIMFVIVN